MGPASWSKASCLGLAIRNVRWFESSWGKKGSHEISASIWDWCPPSIVMHLGSYNRYRSNALPICGKAAITRCLTASNNIWLYLKPVNVCLSCCPPSNPDGSEAVRKDSPVKVTLSTKKKRRRVLSDSDEDEGTSASSSPPPEKKASESPSSPGKKNKKTNVSPKGVPRRKTAPAPDRGAKELLPGIAKVIEASKASQTQAKDDEVVRDKDTTHENQEASPSKEEKSESTNHTSENMEKEETAEECQNLKENHVKAEDKSDEMDTKEMNGKESPSKKPVHSFFAPRKTGTDKEKKKTSSTKDNSSGSVSDSKSTTKNETSKDAGVNYDPTKSNYHPIDNAFWSRGERFESSWGKKFSHEISASVWDQCPPSIVTHLGNYYR
ncbi:hypothetical protein ANN_17229 [Periplaneta americana]|uniref:Uncharacterized protein n=1 Tax=Periplaneta americana TaxID=6978 RepID=A0ABQ8SSD5_PERAM|nr:hypothetical protein ANN_17229 [Periplaneta americana]